LTGRKSAEGSTAIFTLPIISCKVALIWFHAEGGRWLLLEEECLHLRQFVLPESFDTPQVKTPATKKEKKNVFS